MPGSVVIESLVTSVVSNTIQRTVVHPGLMRLLAADLEMMMNTVCEKLVERLEERYAANEPGRNGYTLSSACDVTTKTTEMHTRKIAPSFVNQRENDTRDVQMNMMEMYGTKVPEGGHLTLEISAEKDLLRGPSKCVHNKR